MELYGLLFLAVFGRCDTEFGLKCAAEITRCLKTTHGLYLAHRHAAVPEQVLGSCQFSLAYINSGIGTCYAVYLPVECRNTHYHAVCKHCRVEVTVHDVLTDIFVYLLYELLLALANAFNHLVVVCMVGLFNLLAIFVFQYFSLFKQLTYHEQQLIWDERFAKINLCACIKTCQSVVIFGTFSLTTFLRGMVLV